MTTPSNEDDLNLALQRLESGQTTIAEMVSRTSQQVLAIREEMATKSDLEGLATKADIENLLTILAGHTDSLEALAKHLETEQETLGASSSIPIRRG